MRFAHGKFNVQVTTQVNPALVSCQNRRKSWKMATPVATETTPNQPAASHGTAKRLPCIENDNTSP